MRYIIYGAGGIGSIMGGHLARTGHNVILIGRPDSTLCNLKMVHTVARNIYVERCANSPSRIIKVKELK